MTIMIEPSSADVFAVVDEVWSTFLGADDLTPLIDISDLGVPGEPAPIGSEHWDAAITISGAWQGVVLIGLDDALAGVLTDTMLGLTPGIDQRSPDDVVDALGELVNVVGGNIKSLMPGPSRLSLPLVSRAPIRVGSFEESCRMELMWGPHRLRVTVGVPADGRTSGRTDGAAGADEHNEQGGPR